MRGMGGCGGAIVVEVEGWRRTGECSRVGRGGVVEGLDGGRVGVSAGEEATVE